jgi:outer membrane receptor protein involved in Fe transport
MPRHIAIAARWLAVVVALIAPPLAWGQSASGGIRGTVTTQQGEALPGATVTLRQAGTGFARTVTTDAHGTYAALLLPVGDYSVDVAAASFKRWSSVLTIVAGESLIADFEMRIDADDITIFPPVSPLADTRPHQAPTLERDAIAQLPVNGRNLGDLALTVPGVAPDVRPGDLSISGQRGTLNSFVVDGALDDNTYYAQPLGRPGIGRAPYQLSLESVDELQIASGPAPAEYGRAGAGIVSVVTRSGTNTLYGSAFEYYRDRRLNANSYANTSATPQRPRSPYHYDQFGASLGGPLVRDRTFFFLDYEGQRSRTPNPVTLNTAGLPQDHDTLAGLERLLPKAGDWERTQNQDVLFARIDTSLGPRHRVSVRYNYQNFTGGNLETSGPQDALEHTGDSLVRTHTLQASLSSAFDAGTFNELRVHWAQDTETGTANSDLPEANIYQGGQLFLSIGRNVTSPRDTTLERLQVADTLAWARGRHAFKGGFDLSADRIHAYAPNNFSGSYVFNSIASFNRGLPAGPGEFYLQAFPGPGTSGATTHPDVTAIAAFLQDEWRVTRDFTLSLGVRYDAQSFAQPTVRNPDQDLLEAKLDTGTVPTDWDNVGPRLGFAWRLGERTVLRGGYGLFYGQTPALLVSTVSSSNGVNVRTAVVTEKAPPYPGTLDSSILDTPAARAPILYLFDPNFENPQVHQGSLAFERDLGGRVTLGIAAQFVGARKLPRNRDVNLDDPETVDVPVQGGGSVTVERFPSGRPLPQFGRIQQIESSASSTYRGITVELRRSAGRFQGRLAYTLGKVTDTVPDATAVVPGSSDDAKLASNPANPDADHAPGNDDQRHRLVLSGAWDLAYGHPRSAFARALLTGWSVSWIATATSGLPYSKAVFRDLNNDGNVANDIVPGSRNSQRLPAIFDLDARLARRIPLGAKTHLDLLVEGFNLLNSTQISARQSIFYNYDDQADVLIPQQAPANPRASFGADLRALDARILQIAVRLSF